jgi:hypothetical protein
VTNVTRAGSLVLPAAGLAAARSHAPALLDPTGDLERLPDPFIAERYGAFCVFSTGGRPGARVIPIRCSRDLRHWTLCGKRSRHTPRLGAAGSPGRAEHGFRDNSFFKGKYQLY